MSVELADLEHSTAVGVFHDNPRHGDRPVQLELTNRVGHDTHLAPAAR